jgi:hypothetical protein
MNMKLLRLLLLLPLAAPLALGQAAGDDKLPSLPNQPEALVRSFYSEVVALHPLGSPGGASIKTFAPYLSKALLHRIDLNVACQDDWARQNRDPGAKPPFLEFGLYSGDDERSEPTAFHIEKVQAEKDGSIRVDVKLTHHELGWSPWTWNVAAILVREDARLVVNDVIWLKYGPQGFDERLSEYLAQDCDGPHWVGSKKPRSDQKQQR